MGRFGNLKYRDVIRVLRHHGFQFERNAAGSHEIWLNRETRRLTTVPNHPGNRPEGTVRPIFKQAGLDLATVLDD